MLVGKVLWLLMSVSLPERGHVCEAADCGKGQWGQDWIVGSLQRPAPEFYSVTDREDRGL